MYKVKRINELGWGILSDNKYTLKRKPWRIFHDIKLYYEELRCLKKHGCSSTAFWDTSHWFIEVMKDILSSYLDRYKTSFVPVILEDFDGSDEMLKKNEEEFDKYINKMLLLLDKMKENYYWEEDLDQYSVTMEEEMEEAKNEFMKMFSFIFYKLWN